ncbi:MAG: tRNA 2-thiocytidine(32) synthetase TtcA, partial [Candidatus Omnitrophica bacterium]|nr:tRNA 2-thiocytidine(32) synthetase TtcA [Candidatus Omnitrophota bacterium]
MEIVIPGPTKPKGKEYYISKKVGKALADYQMLSGGDRILVAVSGGKDSFTLLKVLRDRQIFSPLKYELLAVHIDPGNGLIDSEALRKYFEENNYNYYIEKIEVQEISGISCFWCAWNRRKTIFKIADKFRCNKVALGHHLDDIVETILLNLFFNAEISAMSPKQEMFEGRLTIIRPLAYVEEKQIISFAREQNLPVLEARCSNSSNSKRTYIARLIKELERVNPHIKKNIFRAIKRIKRDYLV